MPSIHNALSSCIKFLFLAAIFTHAAYGQYNNNYNKVWAFGNHAGLTFTPFGSVAMSTSISILEGCGSVSDTSGNLLFYTDGKKVWDRTGTVMPHGSSIVSFSTGDAAQGATIVPVIGTPNQYYIFSSDVYTLGDVAWSIVDMSLNGGLGDVLGGSGVSMGSGFAEKMTTVAGNNCNVWLILHRRDLPQFWVYSIDATGIHAPVISITGSFAHYNAGVTKVSPNRLKLVGQVCEGSAHGTELFDFNPVTGVVSNCRVLDTVGNNYGAEFSPDNTKLYGSQLYGTAVYQYDVSLPTTSAIIASKTNVGTTSSAGDFKLGPDGKIYIVKNGSSHLDCITNPNGSGSSCGFSSNAVTLASGTNGELGLPNLYFAVIPADTTYTRYDTLSCLLTGGITLTAHDSVLGSYYMWNDGITISRTKSGITTPGIYWVQIFNGCGMNVDTFNVTFKPSPVAITGTPAACLGLTSALADTSSGGVWSSSASSIATIDSVTGLVTAVSLGTSIVSYTLTVDACPATATFSVNPWPAVISGARIVCSGPLYLSDSLTGGRWTSSNPMVATIDSIAGMVSRVALGTTTITYTLPTGCYTTTVVTVNTFPSAITGYRAICIGVSTPLSDSVAGGTWSSGSPGIASIGSSSGIVTGVSAGIATITYTLPSGCTATATVTVNAPPAPISGWPRTCVGSTTFLIDPGGGLWSSGATGIATIAPTGVVSGISPGVALITYSMGLGCNTTIPVTVSALPAPITGLLTICTGTSTTLSDALGGGYWVSVYPSLATIDSATGMVSGIAAGAATISYAVGAGTLCAATTTVNVVPPPAAISGIANVCPGQTLPLYESGSGTWSSGTPSIATIGSASGIVSAISSGVATISYSLSPVCYTSALITVDAAPAAITGPGGLCIGLHDTLHDVSGGGYWSSNDYSIANIDAATGMVTGVTADTTTISYTSLSTGCYTSRLVTVYPTPGPITGSRSVCSGSSTTLHDGVGGGVWTSGSPGIAAIGTSSGICSGIAYGTSLISYTIDGVCSSVFSVSVFPMPAAITGASHLCPGTTSSLTDAVGGGIWSSTSPGIASVGSGGLTTGIASGVATISYSFGGGLCTATTTVTVNPSPAPITGTTHTCIGSSATLTASAGGGTWLSGSPSVAAIGSASGIITGLSAGTSTITCTSAAGCLATIPVTVNPLPSVISGPASVCLGTSITETCITPGGTWSRSNTNIAIGSVSGVVTGISSGTVTITYTLPSGCYTTRLLTVNASASPITGTLSVCQGSTTALGDVMTGGTWTTSAPAIASVGSLTGIVTGLSIGTSNITYVTATGCTAMATVTVNPLPLAITGPAAVCATSSITMTDGTPGGTWTTSGSFASVGVASGVVTGMTAGIATISYVLGTGCMRTAPVTVNTLPVITGPGAVCAGAIMAETAIPSGGAWTSGTTSVATIGSSTGIVTGIVLGTSVITYTSSAGCRATKTVSVSIAPTAISGPSIVCTGNTATLTDGISGGVWTSSTAAVTVGSLSGTVTGLTAGTSTITYSLGTGCTVTKPVTVATSPAAITGTMNICAGATTTLRDATPGGTWSSGTTGIATAGSLTGVVAGVSSGVAGITYTLTGSGCSAAAPVTVIAMPAAIGGPSAVCQGATTTETDAVSGGTWATTSAAAGISPATGTVTGLAGGTAVITYTLGASGSFAGCSVTKTMSVNTVSPISGAGSLCVGATTVYTDASPGGIWTSGSTAIATVGSASGIVGGVVAGTAVITYTSGAGCIATKSVTVNVAIPAITGIMHVCAGSSVSLGDAVSGGAWSGSAPSIAAVSSSGVVTGVASGVANITYMLPSGCGAIASFTVNTLPSAITGSSDICAGATTAFSDASAGGIWSSATSGIASVGSLTGIVTGTSVGATTITYTLATGCAGTRPVTVNPVPAAITGITSVCTGQTTMLSDITSGGTWSSGAPGTATAGSAGMVSGIAGGTAAITYSLPTGCAVSIPVAVIPLPPAITGSSAICIGATTTLGDAVIGGTWTSASPGIASVGTASGIVTGLSSGVATVTYSPATGCSITKDVTVNPLPPPIGGLPVACIGAATTLSETGGGGLWSSSNPAIAVIGSVTGLVSGVHSGVAIITYTASTGCSATLWITVNPLPPTISGSSNICSGATATFTDASPGGTWSSSNISVAAVGSSTGVVTGITGGSATISYTATSGCATTHVVSVTAVPPISGLTNVCAWEDTLRLTDSLTTGLYSSTSVTVTSLGGGVGRLSAHAPGTATIYYTIPLGCFTVATITVNPLPNPITGTFNICSGIATTLHDTSPGGIWSSSLPVIATIGSATGVVTGIGAGTSYITYTLPTGCHVDTPMHVSAMPSYIIGYPTIITGTTTTYSDVIPGGTWSSSNTAVATIGSSTGIARGVSAGVVTFTYTLSSGCYVTKLVSVNLPGRTGPKSSDIKTVDGDIRVIPNPNKGTFTITGVLNGLTESDEEEVQIEITDMLGRAMYKNKITVHNGLINEQVSFSTEAPNGMYMLMLHSDAWNKVAHMVISR